MDLAQVLRQQRDQLCSMFADELAKASLTVAQLKAEIAKRDAEIKRLKEAAEPNEGGASER